MNQKKRSLIAGLLYLSLAIIGPFALLIIPSQFSVDSLDVYVKENLWLLAIWGLLDLIIIAIEIALMLHLCKLFSVYHKTLSMVTSFFRLMVILVMVVNVLFLSIVLVTQGDQTSYLLDYHQTGVYIWQLWFSIHVFLLGYMVFIFNKTLWKYLGVALILGSFGYLIDAYRALFDVDYALLSGLSSILLIFITLSEIGMAIGLIINKVIDKHA